MELTSLRLGRNDSGAVVWKHPYTHCFIGGKSGTGKSNLILNMIQQDSYYPNSRVILDPSDFMASDAYSILKGKAVYSTQENPIGMNPMLLPYGEDVICGIVAESLNQMIVKTTNNEVLTVAMRAILDESVKWNLERNRKSLLHVRDNIAALKGSQTARDGLLARLNFLLGNRTMKRMLCGQDSINIPDLIEKRKTLILSLHGYSEEQFIFAGTLLLNQIKAHFRFGKVQSYKPLRVFIDEFHNFASGNIMSLLKEGRKFKFSFVMATVNFAGISPSIIHELLSVGCIVAFKCASREAYALAREFHTEPQHLQFIEKYHFCYLTPTERGFAKAPSPPYVKKLKPKIQPEERRSLPKWKGWYVSESCQPAT